MGCHSGTLDIDPHIHALGIKRPSRSQHPRIRAVPERVLSPWSAVIVGRFAA